MSNVNGNPVAAPLERVLLDRIEVEPNPAEVLRYLGYPAGARPHPRILDSVREGIRATRDLPRPRGTYSIYPVEARGPRALILAGGAAFTGAIGKYLAFSDRAAVFLATAGPEVILLVEEAMRSGDPLAGLIYNAIGSELAEAAADRIAEDLRGRLRPGEALTLRYSPGYCGMSLSQQRTIFGLIDAGDIGVELLPSLIMKPIKSVSGLIGMGPQEAVEVFGNPCDRCPLLDCRMRR